MRTSHSHFVRLAAFAILSLPCVAIAQASSSTPFAPAQLWEFGGWGSEAVGKTAGQAFGGTQITMAGFHLGRVIHRSAMDSGFQRNLEYTVEVDPLFLVTRVRRTYGGGFSPVGLKWNFTPHGRYRPYIELNGGAMFTPRNVPPGDTSSFNFTAAAGSGVMVALTPTQALSFAVRFWHLSNAYIGNSNPAFNTVQFVVGYNWLTTGRRHRQQLSSTKPDTQAAN
jgi:lipid A 3-O-deacylase